MKIRRSVRRNIRATPRAMIENPCGTSEMFIRLDFLAPAALRLFFFYAGRRAARYQGRDCRHLFLRYIITAAERAGKIEQRAGLLRRGYRTRCHGVYPIRDGARHGTRGAYDRHATIRAAAACRTRETAPLVLSRRA